MQTRPDSDLDFERVIREHLELKRRHRGEPAAQDDKLPAVTLSFNPSGSAAPGEHQLWGRARDFDWGD